MTQQRFDDILNEALQRLAQGATVEECLAVHQEVAADLAPLLQVAQATTKAGVEMAPDPAARQAILGRLTEAWQDRETRRRHRRFPALAPALRPWAIALVAVVALVLTGWGTATAAANSVPGDVLYPVKTVQERFVLAVAPSDHRRARIHARLAEKRTQEMVILAHRGRDTVKMDRLARRMARHTRSALRLVDGGVQAPRVRSPEDAATAGATPRIDPGLRKARSDLHRLMARHERIQSFGMRDLSPRKMARFERIFARSQQELRQAILTLERLEAGQEASQTQ